MRDSKFLIYNSRHGFSVVEGLLAASVLGMFVMALIGLFLYGEEGTRVGGDRMRAVFLAEEGIEAVRNIRDAAYSNLTNSSPTYGLGISGGTYVFSGTQDPIGTGTGTDTIYTRKITITDAINPSTPARKDVVVTVTWTISPSRSGSVALEDHFANWR